MSSNVAAGIIWAADHGARVINLSLGGGPSPGLQIAMQYALRKGAVVLAAAGNNGATGNAPVYPGAYPEAIAVGAFDQSLGRASFSNTGSYVDVSAPGDTILSTWPTSAVELRAAERNVDGDAVRVGRGRAHRVGESRAHSGRGHLDPRVDRASRRRTRRRCGVRSRADRSGRRGARRRDPRSPATATKGTGYWIVAPNGDGARVRQRQGLRRRERPGGSPVVASARTATGRRLLDGRRERRGVRVR